MTTRVLVPSGVLGLGFDAAALGRGMERKPDVICIDGGSTDSGPFYLGTGTTKYARSICAAEWKLLMQARDLAGIPLVMGSCGTCGVDGQVDAAYDMTVEIARELGQRVKIARIYCERKADDMRAAFDDGRITALLPAPEFPATADDAASLTHIVSLAGAEPVMEALNAGADIILAGRATDTAGIAALPLMRGEHAGAAWHGAKIAECGAFCSTNPASGVIVLEVDAAGFQVEAMAALCTPATVAAHMLYENADPFVLHEPGGHLDVRHAVYNETGKGIVRVEGSRWVAAENYTVKLEAAKVAGYQTTLIAVVRDPRYVANITAWSEKLLAMCRDKIAATMQLGTDDYDIDIRLMGRDAALGAMEKMDANANTTPSEIGVLVIITAHSQEIASQIGLLVNPYLLHLPLTDDEDMPTFAFPYSPANTDRGALYEFALNHVLRLDDPLDGFRMRMDEIGNG